MTNNISISNYELEKIFKALPDHLKDDAHYKLYQQAAAADQALIADIENDSPTAGTDRIEIVIGNQHYPIRTFSADVCSALFEFLNAVKSFAIDEINIQPVAIASEVKVKVKLPVVLKVALKDGDRIREVVIDSKKTALMVAVVEEFDISLSEAVSFLVETYSEKVIATAYSDEDQSVQDDYKKAIDGI